jgi:hypothetical protein
MSQIAFEKEEAVARMRRRNKTEITWTFPDVTVRWRYIDGRYARNWDGSLAPNPNCIALEKMVWREGSAPRYSNYW